MQEKVYGTKIRGIEELREWTVHSREEFDQLLIDAAIGQWHARLEAFVETEDGHLEHTLRPNIIQILN